VHWDFHRPAQPGRSTNLLIPLFLVLLLPAPATTNNGPSHALQPRVAVDLVYSAVNDCPSSWLLIMTWYTSIAHEKPTFAIFYMPEEVLTTV
jgi:hypothetical protein